MNTMRHAKKSTLPTPAPLLARARGGVDPARGRVGWVLGASVLIFTAIALGAYLGQRRASAPTSVKTDSIAVLPFDTSSLDPELEYLADGIHGHMWWFRIAFLLFFACGAVLGMIQRGEK